MSIGACLCGTCGETRKGPFVDKLPIYPVATYPDRAGYIVPAIGFTDDGFEAVPAVEAAGFRIREDLDPVWTDRAGAEGWYVFVDGREQPEEFALSGSKKSKKKRLKRAAEVERKKSGKKALVERPKRRKRAKGGGKKFSAQGFNLKKMPLAVATQLLFGQIWPDAYSVSQ